MIEHWGVRALRACVFGLVQGILEPPRRFDCLIVNVFGGLEFAQCEEPSPVWWYPSSVS